MVNGVIGGDDAGGDELRTGGKPNGSTVYVAMSNGNFGTGRLVALKHVDADADGERGIC